jgi:hypothetical protein
MSHCLHVSTAQSPAQRPSWRHHDFCRHRSRSRAEYARYACTHELHRRHPRAHPIRYAGDVQLLNAMPVEQGAQAHQSAARQKLAGRCSTAAPAIRILAEMAIVWTARRAPESSRGGRSRMPAYMCYIWGQGLWWGSFFCVVSLASAPRRHFRRSSYSHVSCDRPVARGVS